MKERVLLGMSGGVDSSASVAKLQEMGYEVIGLTLLLFKFKENSDDRKKQLKDIEDAKKVAEIFNVEHHVEDIADDFQKIIVDDFVSEYLAGRTPSPCVICNRHIKFKVLVDLADKYNCKYVATGHYAKRGFNKKYGEVIFMADNPKDQSYFLGDVKKNVVPRMIFPLQEFKTKDDVRKYIYNKLKEIGKLEDTKIYIKHDSQDICFIKDNDYIKFIDDYLNKRKNGEEDIIEDKNLENMDIFEGTRKIKTGDKIYSYTIGKRRGLNISSAHRLYVIDIDKEKNKVILGSAEELEVSKVFVETPNFLVDENLLPKKVFVKLNYNAKIREASLAFDKESNKWCFKFEDKVRKPAKSQYATFYDNNILLGSAKIIGSEK